MNSLFHRKTLIITVALLSLGAFALIANASHSWGNYHWARITSTFTLKLGDNVSGAWDLHLATTSIDWSAPSATSTVLTTTIVAGGTNPKVCRATSGRVEVCNAKYGNNGWLGIASIWVSGSHITQGTIKVNDTYFNVAPYNTPAWRQFVMCQEVGHTFGLGHVNETFTDPNTGSCMDYTNNPSGPPSNEKPNQHDYDQLATIYSHTDGTTTVGATASPKGNNADVNVNTDDPSGFGKAIQKDSKGKTSLYERDLGKGEKLFTFVIWAE